MSSQLRWDVLERQWRIVSGGRQQRPNLPDADCPFCPGGLEAPNPYRVRVFPNRWPPMEPGPAEAIDSLREPLPARGAAEIILYTSDHHGSLGALPDDHLAEVVAAWRARTLELGEREEVDYVLCFENRGAEVGATIHHPHGQIYGFPFVPPRPKSIMAAGLCRVCQDMVSAALGLAEDGKARCWVPSASPWPYAFRLAPLRHVGSLAELRDDEEAAWRSMLSSGLRALDALWGTPMPYMLDLHQAPTDGDDWHAAHMWLEVACPLRAPGLMRFVAAGETGSGTYQNPIPPEDAHRALSAVWA